MGFRHLLSAMVVGLLSPAAFGALQVPEHITVEAEGPNGTVVGFQVKVVGDGEDDRGRTTYSVVCSPAALSTFPLGTTTVSCSASEGSTGSFQVTVVDTTAPVLVVPDTISVVTGDASTPVTFTATATDVVDGAVAVSCSPASGFSFPQGTTEVSCTASDSALNSATAAFEVVVSTAPLPEGPNPRDITAEATGPFGVRVHFPTGEPEDDGGRPGSADCSPAPGSLFPFGVTTVTCPSFSFAVTVVDTTPPALTIPAEMTVMSSVPLEVGFDASAYDLVDGYVAIACTPSSGSLFPLGETTVTCTATDSRNNTATASFVVDVTDDPPFVPVDLEVEATGPGGAAVSFDDAPSNCSPSSGSLFPLGVTTVTCGAITFRVTVIDTTPPQLTLPGDQTLEATSAAGAVATFTTNAFDLVDGFVSVSCSHPSGSTFALGTTTVECSAADSRSNAVGGTFQITVVDTTPPALTLPADLTLHASSPAGEPATFTATAEDLVDGSVPVSCTPPSGSTFPLGMTVVDCTASDAADNEANGSFTIVVIDADPPVIGNLSVSPATIWPPNGKMIDIDVTADVTDNVDAAPVLQIFDITCDEPIAAEDAVITDDLEARLRAERDAHLDGRVYTIWIEAIDQAGNRSVASVQVVVPHDSGESSSTNSRRRSVGRP